MNLFDLLNTSVESTPDKAALVFGERSITYGQLFSAARRVSARLKAAGARVGDRVLMYSPNCPEYLAIYLGCAHMGAIFAPINTAFRAREMSYVLDNARATLAFVHSDVIDQFHSITPGVPAQNIAFGGPQDEPIFQAVSADEDRAPAVACAADHGALLCYTSGSTSTPKPVLHSHGSEVYAALGYVAAWRMQRSDRGLVTLPLAWIYGLSSASLALLVAGATVNLMTHFNPERALEAIEETRATVFFGSMSMYTKMLDVLRRRQFDLTSLRLCTNGAEPCPDASVQAFEKRTGLKLINAYALSEARPLIAQDPLDSEAPSSTCGRLVPGAAVRLLDSSGRDVPTGELGEAFIRCPGMLTDYFREPHITAERLDSAGWLRTGDLLRRDARGYYFVAGRTGDMIIRSGVNIAPAEIESALLEHAQVSQAVALGVPDPVSGQAIVAFVVPSAGATLDEGAMREHLKARIAAYKLPQRFVLRQDLPSNASGKLDRTALSAVARQLMAPVENSGTS